MAKRTEIDYSPYPHQVPIHESPARFLALMFPIRSGKDYSSVGEAAKRTIDRMEEWKCRTEMTPRWNIWAIAPTMNPGGRQLWRDILRVWPRETIKKINRSENTITLINDGVIQLKSAEEPEKLVSEPVDLVLGTECGIWKRSVWSLSVRGRLSSPGRLGSAILNGTPQGQTDPENPNKFHWWWQVVLNGRNPDVRSEWESFYWFEDKLKEEFMGPNKQILLHPILSRTAEGRQELQSVKNDPDVSERDYRQNYLGECMPMIAGQAIVKNFKYDLHVMEFPFMPSEDVLVTIDFGSVNPFAIVSQYFKDDNEWYILGEYHMIENEDHVLDEDFVEGLYEYIKIICPGVTDNQIKWAGDFESNQYTDQRPENTRTMMLKKFGVTLLTRPTLKSDEKHAIDVINGQLRVRTDQRTGLVLHPRCVVTVKAMQGGWVRKQTKVRVGEATYTAVDERVAEVHPWIDCFDACKYAVMHFVRPNYSGYNQPQAKPSYIIPGTNFSESGMPMGKKVSNANRGFGLY